MPLKVNGRKEGWTEGRTDGCQTTGDGIGTAFAEPKRNIFKIKYNETHKLFYDTPTVQLDT